MKKLSDFSDHNREALGFIANALANLVRIDGGCVFGYEQIHALIYKLNQGIDPRRIAFWNPVLDRFVSLDEVVIAEDGIEKQIIDFALTGKPS